MTGVENTKKIKYKMICEVCGKEEIYDTLKDAYMDGWDTPPYIGQFGIIGTRTCPDCTVEETTWWKLYSSDALNSHDLEVIDRIKREPESLYITVDNDD